MKKIPSFTGCHLATHPISREPLLDYGLLIELDISLCEEVVVGLITCVGEVLVIRPHFLGDSQQGYFTT